jgi:hypothetical protein
MYLDVDFQTDALAFLVNQASELPGVISVFRNLSPVAGSKTQVHFPAGL